MRTVAAAALIAITGSSSVLCAQPFFLGGDVSLLPFIESRGGSFRDAGQVMPADRIMVARGGANLFRLRLFVNPNPNYSATAGAIQDLPYTIALAQRLQDSGARILLDFHYSDTWADPGSQTKPAAWSTYNFATLNSTVRSYTRDTLLAFRDAGVMPEMVQVGNEITNGMLWNDGRIIYSGTTQQQQQSWMNFGSLLNSAIQGVRDVDAMVPGQHTDIAVHIDGGDVQGRAQYFFTNLTNIAGVSGYDTIGLSFYPNSTSDLANLQANLNWSATNTTKNVMVLETNYPWKGSATGAQWPSTPTGQRDFFVAVRDMVRNLPNNRGRGVVWWYPEAIQVPGTFIWQGGAIALFDDSGGDALPALDAMLLPAPTWNLDADGTWGQAANWAGGMPDGAGQIARFGSAISAARNVSLDSPRWVGTISFNSINAYTLSGAVTLTLDAGGNQPARIDVIRGSHAVLVPLVAADDLEINVAWSNSLAIRGELRSAGRRISKLGSGTAELENIRAAGLDVRRGTVRIRETQNANSAAGTSRLGRLSIAGTVAAPTARLDLTNNSLVIDSASLADVTAWLKAGLENGGAFDWLGPGIGSTQANVQNTTAGSFLYGLGVILNDLAQVGGSGPIYTDFAGQTLSGNEILVKFTYFGDADLSGSIDATDYSLIDNGYVNSLSGWINGDFDYSGSIDATDYALIDNAYVNQAGPLAEALIAEHARMFGGEYLAALRAIQGGVMPEPAVVGGVWLVAALLATGRTARSRRRSG